MDKLDAIAPTTKERVMDLVSSAGIDVSDWANYKGGAAKAAANPKYCYEWSFVEPGKLVLLNLWHQRNRLEGERIVQTNNFRIDAERYSKLGNGTWSRRAHKIDDAIKTALRENLALRVILLDGEMSEMEKSHPEPSKVKMRCLDSELWTVVQYDNFSGENTIARGIFTDPYVDQFSLNQFEKINGAKKERVISAHVRNPEIRRRAMNRAGGYCEHCKEKGFEMENGNIYLETHHIISLAEGGPDTLQNVIALCPNDHMRAHYGLKQDEFRELLFRDIS